MPHKNRGRRIPNSIFGMAAVFWVACELSRRNWIALPTLRNLKGVDIIAQHPGNAKRVEIQVKALQARKGRNFWLLGAMNRKDIPSYDPLFFVFVRPCSRDDTAPFEALIVPSAKVKREAQQQKNKKFQFCWYPPEGEELERCQNRWDALA